MIGKCIARMQMATLSAALGPWVQLSSARRQQQAVMRKVLHRMRHALLGAAVSSWRQAVRLRAVTRRCVGMLLNQRLTAVWRSWTFAVGEQSRLRMVTSRVVLRTRTRLILSAVGAWAMYTDVHIRDTKLKAALVDEKVAARRWQVEKSDLELRVQQSQTLLRELQEDYGNLEASSSVLVNMQSKQAKFAGSSQHLHDEFEKLKMIVAAEKCTNLELKARLAQTEMREGTLRVANIALQKSLVR